jgi:hypothetical protein
MVKDNLLWAPMIEFTTMTARKFLSLTLAIMVFLCPLEAGALSRSLMIKGAGNSEDIASASKVLATKPPNPKLERGFNDLAPSDTASQSATLPTEEKKNHLARDITVFVITSAFVGYFIAKVFIQGDTSSSPSSGNGKDIPSN